MKIKLATKTLIAFEDAVRKDQGSAYRGFLGKVIPHIGDAYRTGEDGFRSHMGASGIGQECARAVWYNFRWVYKPNFSGKILRLFNRGHLEEARFIALLLTIGCKVYQQDANGNQFRISHAGGHFGGSGDGVTVGLPDVAEGVPVLSEFKTHGDKSFIELTKKGLRDAKFQHYVQMQVYMRKMNLTVGFYLAVNKNTDELYGEIITLDTATADQFLDRGHNLVFLDAPPEKINSSPGFFKCVYCDFKHICHLGVAPEVNCRTCMYSSPKEDGTWYCKYKDEPISKKQQLDGCYQYIKHSNL